MSRNQAGRSIHESSDVDAEASNVGHSRKKFQRPVCFLTTSFIPIHVKYGSPEEAMPAAFKFISNYQFQKE